MWYDSPHGPVAPMVEQHFCTVKDGSSSLPRSTMAEIITVECEFCGVKFETPDHRRRFCGLPCSSKRIQAERKPKPNAVCAFCDKEFRVSPSRLKLSKSGMVFCARWCKDQAQRLGDSKFQDMIPGHYGSAKDYRSVAFSHYDHACARCGWCEHVETLVVHHKDRDRSNSEVANLEILCVRCHDVEHYLAGDGRWALMNKK